MASAINTLLREIHRIRLHLRELHNEIENQPRKHKAHLARIAKNEQTLKDALDQIKSLKAANGARELQMKSTAQQLQKFEKQMSDMKTPKEVEAKETEIASAKLNIQALEDSILSAFTDIEEKTAKIPPLEEQVKKAKADFAKFETESKEHLEKLQTEMKRAEAELKSVDSKMPEAIRGQYDRLFKAHGPDALAAVKDRSCGNCHTAVTAQNLHELVQGRFIYCNSCGRGLYLMED
ncbi:MAG: hypothetical protein K8T89_21585 [Planctomycetes bacterium]|nr:hypothetical protein [Planctomycetota bacterium]